MRGDYDRDDDGGSRGGTRVYVGGLDREIKKEDLELEFQKYGKLNSVWVAYNPPGFAFIEFDERRDAEDACSAMNNSEMMGARLKVEISRNRGSRGGGGGGGSRGGGRGRGRDDRSGGFRGGRGRPGFGGRGGGFRGKDEPRSYSNGYNRDSRIRSRSPVSSGHGGRSQRDSSSRSGHPRNSGGY